jgi:GNAT superfamily N-acetyltransferase
MVFVRPASSDDLDVLLEFEQALIEAERPFDPAIRTDDDVRYYDLEHLIASPDTEVVVAEIDAEVIGCGYARIENSKPYLEHSQHSYVGFMYVVPEHRGKGVNKRIIEYLEVWSASRGVVHMTLEVYAQNSGAIRAYERSGYHTSVIEMHKELMQDPD